MEVADTGQRVIQTAVFTDKLQFLNSIRGNFLNRVDPSDSVFLDELLQNGAIDSDQYEQIRLKPTCRDKARETWILLNQLPPKRFWESCYPVLRVEYPHVLEEKVLRWDEKLNDEEEQCIRHAIMTRTELKRFGDLFPLGDGCTLNEYRAFGDTNPSWELAFKLCERRSNWDNPEFTQKLEDLLESIEVDVPVNFREVVAGGFHCTCSPQRPTPMVRRRKKRKKPAGSKKPCDEESSDVYPASTQDDPCEDGCSVSIDSSSDDSWDAMPEESDEEGDIRFDTPETEEKFLKELDKIKHTIKKCSNTRTLYNEAVCIGGRLLILCAIRKQRGVEDASADDEEINKLRREVKKIAGIMKKDYDTVKKIKEEAEYDTELQNLPPFARKIFLEHRQRLICEFNEIKPFPEAVERKLESGSYKFAFANCARENRCFNFTDEHRHATVPTTQNQ